MKLFLLTIIGLLVGASQIYAQTWRVYSPPDKSFRVKLPAPLREVASFEGEHGANLEPDQKEENVTSYAAIETTPEDSRFGIVVINGSSDSYRSIKRKELLDYVSAVVIGDDDESQFMKAPVVVRSNGLRGNEYFYVKVSTLGSSLFTRGRIFVRGTKIYVIVFVGKNAKDLKSPDAALFFNSFRIRTRGRNNKD